MEIEAIKKNIYSKGLVYAGLLIGCFVCYAVIINNGYAMGAVVGCMPFLLICLFYLFKSPYITFVLLFVVNYFIMGINRYIYFPVWMVMDSLFAFTFASLIFKTSYIFNSWKQVNNGMFWSCLVWLIYCILEIANIYGTTPIEWFQGVRGMALYPIFTVIFVSLLLNKYKDIHCFLMIWAFFTILASAKGYWQKNHGFDPAELTWLFSGGGRTHLIVSGIRFFSFFTDAGNYGSSMGLSMVTFLISAFFIKNKWLKIYFIIAGLAGGYGMMISGTRWALSVVFAGFALFSLLSKKKSFLIGSLFLLTFTFCFLHFTTVGDDNRVIHRMRTSLDSNDASLNIRLINRATLAPIMKDLPFGIGIGANLNAPLPPKYKKILNIPTDSWLVFIWTRTGAIGLILYLLIWGYIIIHGSYITLFKIRNNELKGILIGMLCGTFGMMVAMWAGQSYTQYPNCVLIYICQTLVFLGPYFDKQISKNTNQNQLSPVNDNPIS